MKTLKFLFSKTLIYYFWEEFRLRWYFKYELPKIKEITLDGIRLDVSGLPPKIRNRLKNAGYEAHEKKMCQDFLTASDTVVEVGGAIGFIGLFCQKKMGIRQYTIFEANPRTVEMLKRNFALNGLQPNIHNMALASAEGHVELEVGSDFWENSIVPLNTPGQGRHTIEVPAITFEGLLKMLPYKPNVLIVDIEGAEQFISFNQIPDEINKVIIELHPHLIGPEITYNIVSSIISKGFRVAREEGKTFVFLRK